MAPFWRNRTEKGIWEGNAAKVAKARVNYYSNPYEGFIPYMSALYSFRARKEFAEELIGLRDELLMRANEEIVYAQGSFKEIADRADVLSTILQWILHYQTKRLHALHPFFDTPITSTATTLCWHGILSAEKLEDGDHSWDLLQLTYAWLLLENGGSTNRRRAYRRLTCVIRHAPHIRDPKQRMRVYSKLGFLLRMAGHYPSGYYWGIRGCLVWGVPFFQRAKSFAALAGVVR